MILAFLATRAGQAVAIAIAVVLAFLVFLARHDAKVEKRAEVKIVQRSEAKGKENAANAAKAHAAARAPGAADRLHREACRDCDGEPVQKLASPDGKPKR